VPCEVIFCIGGECAMRISTRTQGWRYGKYLLIILPLGMVLAQENILTPSPTDIEIPVRIPAHVRVDMGEWRGKHLSPVQKISTTLKRNPLADSIAVVWRVRGLNTYFEFEDIYDRRRGVLESKVTLHNLTGSSAVTKSQSELHAFANVTDKTIYAAGQKGLWGQPLVNLLKRIGCKALKPNSVTIGKVDGGTGVH
jgi:hypothetical protein